MKQALLKLHIAVFLWGFTGVLGRLISLNEGLLVWYRLLITIITLYVVMRSRGGLPKVLPARRNQLFLIGIIVALHWCFFYGSIKYSNVSIALTCLSSAGLFTALLEPLFNRRRIIVIEVLLGLIGIAGIALIFHFDPQYKTGIVLGIICTILSCVFAILNKKEVAHTDSNTMMLYELSGGFIFLTLVIPFYLKAFPPLHLLPQGWDSVWLLLLSWLCTIVAMGLSLQALTRISAFTQNLTLNLEPVYGIILAFAVFHENKDLSHGFFIGFGLIILAVILQMARVVKRRTTIK